MFFILHMSGVTALLEDAVTGLAFEYGATGVSENLNFNKKVYPEPEIIESEFKTLSAYFDTSPSDFASLLQKEYPQISILISQEENKDWLEEWKKGFKSFQLVDRFWIVPSWEKENSPTDIDPIYIDPGMAFGTGTHETTQLCSELLFEVLNKNSISSVLDVGTGTGILAFLAKKMQIPLVLGTDNDPEAIRVAYENAAINSLNIEFTPKDLPLFDSRYDLVLANIIDGVLLQMKHSLFVKAKKYLIVSGILIENDKDFIQEFLNPPIFKIMQRKQKGEWVSYLLERSLPEDSGL